MEHDLEAMRAELRELRALVTALREHPERDERPPETTPGDRTVSRRRLLTALAGVGAAGAAGVANASPAAAADGDPIVMGQDNLSTAKTLLSNADSPGQGIPDFPTLGNPGSALLRLEDVRLDNALVALGTSTAIAAGGFEGMRVWGDAQGLVVGSDGIAAFGAVAEGDATAAVVYSENAQAIWASSDIGIQLVLAPSAIDGPGGAVLPGTTKWAEAGSISVDQNKDVWLCTEGGAEPVWTRLLREDTAVGRTVAITPIRAIDTRFAGGRPAGSPVIPGQKAGPLKGGTSVTLDLAGITPIPTTATGVIGNLTAVTPSYAGWLTAGPSGAATTTSALNFPSGVAAIANAFTSQLGPDGLTITASGTTANTYHLIIDITAYIT